jgi:hypothetical protein
MKLAPLLESVQKGDKDAKRLFLRETQLAREQREEMDVLYRH